MNIDPHRLAEFEAAHLAFGSHPCESKEKCDREWAAYLLGEAHSDNPNGEDPVINRYRRRLNDRFPDEDRDLLKPSLVRGLGSRGDYALTARRAMMLVDWRVRVHMPLLLDAAGLAEQAAALRACAEITDEASFKRAFAVYEKAVSAALDALAALDARAWRWNWPVGWVALLAAARAAESLGADATKDQREKVALDTLLSLAKETRQTQIAVLDRMIDVRE